MIEIESTPIGCSGHCVIGLRTANYWAMPCLAALISLAFPRLVLLCVWLFSGYLGRAYHTILWPLLGFLFMPLTTLAYAWAINSNGSVSGGFFVIVLLAALIDLGRLGGSSRARRRRRLESEV